MIIYAPIFCLLPGTPSCLFRIQNPFKEARNVKISTSHVDGHRPISIVYLSDSGDLKLAKILHFLSSHRAFGDISQIYGNGFV